ncbi:MAG: hypothetical protein QXK34_03790, partial [Candidatus Bathyarchaeia archaeon]
ITPGYRIEKNLETASLEFSPLLEREIISNYMLGFDLITVASKDRLRAEDLERMKAVTRRLIGLEIVEENSRTVKLQCLLEPTAFPPERILRREYLLVASMHRDLILCLSEKDVHLADSSKLPGRERMPQVTQLALKLKERGVALNGLPLTVQEARDLLIELGFDGDWAPR